MANAYAANFPIPSATNVFQCIWKLTRVMKSAGWIYKASSDGTTKETTGVATSDKWGGNANPLLDTYPPNSMTDATAGWIVLEGPSTIKIPLNAAPTGVFLRGEKITQATSLAEGELLGHVWDTVSLSGWAAILPMTGTFNNTNVVTGASGGATFTPTGTVIEFKRQIVFSKSSAASTIAGQIFYIVADASGESAQLYSALATQTGCTAAVPPGGGSTNNGFPVKGIAIRGTGGGVTVGNWFQLGTSFQNNAQIGCVNATPSTGVSADGSFYCLLSNTSVANTAYLLSFTRLDDTEPGDCDPYIWWAAAAPAPSTWSATASVLNTAALNEISTSLGMWVNNTTGDHGWVGYSARGCPIAARDGYMNYAAFGLQYNTSGLLLIVGFPSAMRVLNHPAATGSTPMVRDHYTIGTPGSPVTQRQIKGRTRWIASFPVGSTYDTYDNKTWIACSIATATTGCVGVGPYDGSTTPVQ